MKKARLSFAQRICVKAAGKAMHRGAMIRPGARVGVAVSGGMDSFVLLKALLLRRRIVPFHFEIMALHVNPGFDPHSHDALIPWLKEHGVAAHIEVTDHGPHAHSEENKRNSACFRCAWLRRKRLFELCARYRLSHLAFGHNADDLVHTFFLNLCQNGRVDGMSMRESFFGGALEVVRPLLFLEKSHIRRAAGQWNLPVWANPCPSAGSTRRSDMAQILEHLYGVHKDARRCIFNGLARWQLERGVVQADALTGVHHSI